MPRGQDRLDGPCHLAAVERVARHADGVGVALQDAGDHVLIAELVACDLDALDAGELVADKLLQRLLHLRIALVAQLHREADDRRLRDLDGLAEAAGGHERGLVVVGQDVGRDLFLALGKGVDIILNIGQNVCRHNKFPPLRPCSTKIIKSLLFYRLRPHFASRNHDLGKIL